MPIRFACEQCGQKLSARSRQVGRVAKCPKCKYDVTVPEISTRASSESRSPSTEFAENGEADPHDVYAQFTVYDDDAEWVYEDDPDQARGPSTAVTIERVSIPRNILYLQGILLALVAIVSFVFGILVGGGSSTAPEQVSGQPCNVGGHVRYLTQNGAEIPDEGAVVIIVPQDAHPTFEQRAAVEGLRPSDPLPQENHPALQAIRKLGGAYARTDQDGAYDLRLPASGQYFVLVLSRNRYRDVTENPVRADLAQIGGFFLPATDLLGDHRYEWRSVSVRSDQTFSDVVF